MEHDIYIFAQHLRLSVK